MSSLADERARAKLLLTIALNSPLHSIQSMIVLECQATYPIRNSEIVQQEHVGLALAAHRGGRLEDSDLTTEKLKPAWLFFPGLMLCYAGPSTGGG